LLCSHNQEPGRWPCTPGTGAGERLSRGSRPVPAKQTAVALLPPAAHADARAGTSCTFGVHIFFGSFSRGTAGLAIWQFLPGYLASSDALTVLAKSRSTERYLVPAGPLAIACSNRVFLLPKISPRAPRGRRAPPQVLSSAAASAADAQPGCSPLEAPQADSSKAAGSCSALSGGAAGTPALCDGTPTPQPPNEPSLSLQPRQPAPRSPLPSSVSPHPPLQPRKLNTGHKPEGQSCSCSWEAASETSDRKYSSCQGTPGNAGPLQL